MSIVNLDPLILGVLTYLLARYAPSSTRIFAATVCFDEFNARRAQELEI